MGKATSCDASSSSRPSYSTTVQLSCNGLGKVAEDSSSVEVSAILWETWIKCLLPGSDLALWGMNQRTEDVSLSVFPCLCTFGFQNNLTFSEKKIKV